jgi:hypothetical protein
MTAILSAMLLSALPSPGLPPGADSLLVLALDSLGLEPAQMNFDRNWAPAVKLPDSIVILCLQDVFAIPGVLAGHVADARLLLDTEGAAEGSTLQDLVSLATELDGRYRAAASTFTPQALDTLAGLAASLWADTDNPGEWGEWGSFHRSRGLAVPPEFEGDPDTLALWLERWPDVEQIDPAILIGIALALRDIEWHEPTDLSLTGVEGSVTFFDQSSGYIVGGPEDNTYGPGLPFGVIVDIGGNDTYLDMGGAFGPSGSYVSIIIDLEGDDRYTGPSPVSCGAGLMGFGAVVDLEGNDVYEAGPVALGAGLMGQGILADLSGDDTYTCDFFGQGAGCLGTGYLIDYSGDDYRRVSCFGQGFGGPAGLGVLADGAGHDCYLAGFRYSHAPLRPDDNRAMSQGFAMGFRPVVAGGRGLLADFGSGNDTYRAEIFGQGGAYWYGLGMLFDEDGQDCYNAAQYAQGSGIHLASGCLWDGGGDDGYYSHFGPSQGAAHDLSTAFFYDASGQDAYISDGAQGFSINNSAVIFIDSSGADTYCCGGDGQGAGSWSRGSASVCAFIDMEGDDRFLGRASDSLRWTDGAYGAGIDAAVLIPVEETPPELIGNPEELDLDSLFSVASEWDVGENRDRVQAHREELARRGAAAIDYIIANHMNTTDGLALRAMEDAIRANAEYALPELLACLESLSGRRLRNCIYLLGVTGGEEARLPLEAMLPADSTGTGLSVVKALGSIGNPASLPVIQSLAADSSERIRREVAVALGEIGDSSAVPVLRVLAGDWYLDVRSAAENSLRLLEGTE